MARELKHIGIPRRSGRYPWGSGRDGYQRNPDLAGQISKLRKQGLSEAEIAEGMGKNTAELRRIRSLEKDSQKINNGIMALRLKEKGLSNVEIGKRMGVNESVVRSWLNPTFQERAKITQTIANRIRDRVDEVKYLDVGTGTEVHLGISRTKLDTAIFMLQQEGYVLQNKLKISQENDGKFTTYRVLTPPGVTFSELSKNRHEIRAINDVSDDGGRSFRGLELPLRSVNSDRIYVRYNEDGGGLKDGVIELRRGVDDISLGSARYAQVRIPVDGTHFMKGMALHTDDIPDGYDIVYNTRKSNALGKMGVFKKMKKDPNNPEAFDPDNPIGASLKQKYYTDANGKKVLSSIMTVGLKEGSGEEGSWGEWSKTLSSQFLSKQKPDLAKKQLELARDIRKEQFDEIMSLTNPAVKQVLLKEFADSCDADAVHLKAAALPRQISQVLLPVVSMKEGEVYAPNYKNGEVVVLIRHPHGGTFEIPQLVVNNKNKEAIRNLGNAKDAIGINPKVATKLSGADFDGDTVLVIKNNKGLVETRPALKALQNFDHLEMYKGYPGMVTLSDQRKQQKMGEISNLITDMTIRGANTDELARAVKHSMVVIDATNHNLNWKQSAIDNNITDLKKKYQGGPTSGASTIISRAKSPMRIPVRREGMKVVDPKTGKQKRVYIDPKTGRKLYEDTGETYIVNVPNKKGPYHIDPVTKKKVYTETIQKRVTRMQVVSKLEYETDARKLSSGTKMEEIYAAHSNDLKALANTARLAIINTPNLKYSHSARTVYNEEVTTLKAKLRMSLYNRPLERQARLLANKVITAKRRANPSMDKATLKKIRAESIEEARRRTKAKKEPIKITDREWEAIQAGAISHNFLVQILMNTDPKTLKERSLPRSYKGITPGILSRAKSMLANGYTTGEIASALGVSANTLRDSL